MKKLIALLLVLTMAFTLCACGTSAEETTQTANVSGEGAPPEGPTLPRNIGTLSLLNMTEEEYAAFVVARKKAKGQMIEEGLPKYFDFVG